MTSANDSTLASPRKLSQQETTSSTGSQPFASAWVSDAMKSFKEIEALASNLQSQLASDKLSREERKSLMQAMSEVELLSNGLKPELAIAQAHSSPRFAKLQKVWADAEELAKPANVRKFNVLAILGSNQSGKSFSASKIFTKLIRDNMPDESVIWCISPNKEKSIGTQQRYIWQDFPRGALGDAVWTEKNGFGSVNPMVIIHPNSKRIVIKFKTVAQYFDDPDAFESETLSGMWIDEAVPAHVWQVLQMRVSVKNGWILKSTIPSQEWMHEGISNAKEDAKIRCHLLLPRDNPAMTEEAIERMYASITDPVERALRLEGKYAFLDGLVFPEFKADKHVIKEWPKEPMTFYAGMDFGMSHPTVWLLIGVTKAGRYHVLAEYCAKGATPAQDIAAIKPWLEKYPLASSTIIDPAAFMVTKASAISLGIQYVQAGLPVQPAARYSEWNRVIMMKEMFRNDEILVHESCANLIRELKVWKFRKSKTNEPMSGESMEDKHNDSIDALKYALCAQLRYVGEGAKAEELTGVQI